GQSECVPVEGESGVEVLGLDDETQLQHGVGHGSTLGSGRGHPPSRSRQNDVMGYVFLAIAIAGEVVATSFLKLTTAEKPQWWAYVIVVVGYLLAFWMLSLSLGRGVPLGIAYAIWAGVGVVLVALISWLVFKEGLTLAQIIGMALV